MVVPSLVGPVAASAAPSSFAVEASFGQVEVSFVEASIVEVPFGQVGASFVEVEAPFGQEDTVEVEAPLDGLALAGAPCTLGAGRALAGPSLAGLASFAGPPSAC